MGIETRDLRDLASLLFRLGVLRFKKDSPEGKGFKLRLHDAHPEVPLAPLKIYLRMGTDIHPEPLNIHNVDVIGAHLHQLAEQDGISCQYVAGVPSAGEPFAAAMAGCFMPPKMTLKLSKEIDEHGSRSFDVIGAKLRRPGSALLVDDVATRAHSKIGAIAALRKSSFEVSDVCVIIDREEGAREILQQEGVRLHNLFKLSDLLAFYVKKQFIPEEDRQEVLAYSQSLRGLLV